MTVFHLLIYLSVLIFLTAVAARIVRIVRMPVHLRWELYPVPHEKSRSAYGGSILEEVNWWTKEREVDRIGEAKAMVSEIFFLKGIWEHNRGLWFGSWSLHFGLYLLIGELGLLALSGFLGAVGMQPEILALVTPIVTILAWIGCALGLIGSLIMYLKRLTDPKLKPFNNASHYFNLLLLGAINVTGLIWVAADPEYAGKLVDFFAGLFSLNALPVLTTIGYTHVGIVLFFFIYFPFTHMTHAFVKYFTYHDIRWNDSPNVQGGKMGIEIDKLEHQPVTWAAPHVRADGKKTWVDIVGDTGEEKKS
ncbi:MAG: respiratory nitrate reductase subunit gamma [bacterium]|nr:respiratory nitrate reductase subunit gamma [bacterium]